MRKKRKPGTLRQRLIRFLIFLFGIIVLLFGSILVYNRRISRTYEKSISLMSLLNEYYQDLDALMLAEYGYYYYEGEQDYLDAEETYQNTWDTLQELLAVPMKKECYFSVRNLEEMTMTLREALDDLHRAMEAYHAGLADSLSEVNRCYQQTRTVADTIEERYELLNEKMLDYSWELYEKTARERRVFCGFFVLFLVAACFFVYREIMEIHNSVILPTQELIRAAGRVKEGNFQEDPVFDDDMDKDMRLLADVFQSMVQQLQGQIDTLEENMRIQKELEESRLRELQLQMNPHFMFNTLNMVTETAYLEQADQTAELLKLTAKMFRYSLDFSGRNVTLFKEMEELGSYVSIQEHRFGERIRFLFDLDERFHGIKVPALTVQPLVENAILHGCAGKVSDAEIHIVTKYDEEKKNAWIIVEDNGAGMEEEALQKLREEVENYSTQNSFKVGLGNVYLRLKLLFGDRVEMKIDAEKDRGTRVAILLKETEVDRRVSDPDCG